jgi:F-type H+-transporting ATPase subunit b
VLALLTTVFAASGTEELGTEVADEVSNPILPTLNEMFWAAIFFLALWALMKFVLLPPIMRTFEAREAKVRDDQAAAEAAAAERAAKLEQYEAALAGARAEAVRLIEDARADGEGQRREAVTAAEAEVAAQRAAAAEEIAAAKARARAELTGSIADIAVGAAEAVVERPIDRSAQVQVVEDYVNRAGAQS